MTLIDLAPATKLLTDLVIGVPDGLLDRPTP